MKKRHLLGLALIWLLTGWVWGQTTLERCQSGACYGFGAPTGAAQNGYIYQDLSQTPPALSCGKAGSWTVCGGSGGGGAVASVFTRTGAVTAQAGDYSSFYLPLGGGTLTGPLLLSTATLGGTTTTNPSGQIVNLKQISALYGIGDSYIFGIGVLDTNISSAFALISRDTPAPAFNLGVSGMTSGQITNAAFANFKPDPNFPTVSLIDGGANDVVQDTCGHGAGTACVQNFTNAMNAAEAWLTIPYTFRKMASNCSHTGTWGTDTSLPIFSNANYVAQGTPLFSSTNGGTLTCTITDPSSASTKVGLTYIVGNPNTGTFTVSVDGSNVTNNCTGTTTFGSGPCSGVALLGGGGISATFFRQSYVVTPGASHTVVITLTSANAMDITAVDLIPPTTTANVNAVFVVGINAAFTPSAPYNTASSVLTAGLLADGLQDYFVDLQGGVPGVNTTTDVATSSTANCTASTSNAHPNNCGYIHLAQTVFSTELAHNYQFSSFSVGGRSPSRSGILDAPFAVQGANTTHRSAYSLTSPLNPSYVGSGIDYFCDTGADCWGSGMGTDTTSGKDWSGSFVGRSYGTGSSWQCMALYNGSNGWGDANFLDTACWNYATGASQQNGNAKAPTFQLLTTSAGTCNSTLAGQIQYTQGNSSTKDNIEVCAHDATNTYAWRTIVDPPGNVCAPGPYAAQTDAATVTWAIGSSMCSNASLTFTVHGGSRALNLTGLATGGSYVLWVKQDATGGEGLTLGTGCTWKVAGGGGGTITPSVAANAIDVLAFTYDGASCYATFNKNFN